MKWIAHYDQLRPDSPHCLQSHHEAVRAFVRSYAVKFDELGIAEASGLMHDVGKKSEHFQLYVRNPRGRRGSVPHALSGAFALELMKSSLSSERELLVLLVQHLIAGHHRGLHDFDEKLFALDASLRQRYLHIGSRSQEEAALALSLLKDEAIHRYANEFPETLPWYLSTLLRFAMSALVDADWLDTERYFSPSRYEMRHYVAPSFTTFHKAFLQYKEEVLFKKIDSLQPLKIAVQQAAQEAGIQSHSFFTLHAPTGTGKTIASLEFALAHAIKFNKSRIITALPLTHLTEETSSLYRTIFGQDHVIEDHSNLEPTSSYSPIRHAVERWSGSFVVTTSVKLFQSLFHYRPSRLRKLHRIANSIIIIDEYHKIPLHVLQPILQQLDILQRDFHVTVLFMSATPFPLTTAQSIQSLQLQHQPIEIVDPQLLIKDLPPRISYEWLSEPINDDKLINRICQEVSPTLLIVNTRKEAQRLFLMLKNSSHSFESIYHLSTTMCGEHRHDVLRKIKEDIVKHKYIAIVSTSVLEAGIDISVPVLYRMVAPLDAIVQAAGRCNRYGKDGVGRVVLFELSNSSSVAPLYEAGIAQTKWLLQEKGVERFTEIESFETYYKRIFKTATLNKYGINADTVMQFETIGKTFRLIEDERITVVCISAPGFNEDDFKATPSIEWWKKVQPFMVDLSPTDSRIQFEDEVPVYKGQYDATIGIPLEGR